MTTAVEPEVGKMKVGPLHRCISLEIERMERTAGEAAADGPDQDRFRVVVSSETPVPQWFGNEILDHSERAVDLSRFKKGLALRVVDQLDGSHRVGEQVGVVEEPELKGGKLYGVVRFSRSARAQEVKRDVQDGIRRFVSAGYRAQQMQLEKSDAKLGDTFRVTRWTPHEVSIVTVPADPAATFQRSASSEEVEVELITHSGARHMTTQATPETPAAPAAPAPAPVTGGASAERQRTIAITQLVKAHRNRIPDADTRAEGWLNSDRSVDQVRGEILDLLTRSGGNPDPGPGAPNAGANSPDLTVKEQKEYNICRAILSLADKNPALAPFEHEVHRAIADKVGESQRGGIYVPFRLNTDPLQAEVRQRVLDAMPVQVRRYFERAALDTATSTKGAELKFIEPGPFIELLRNRMVARAMGMRVLTGLQGDLAFPRQTGAGTLSWVPESPTVDVSSSNLLLNQLALAPKIAQSTTSYSRKLLAQAVRDIDQLVKEDLALINALGLDLAALNGTGANNQPTGILNTAGIGSVTMGAQGGQPTYNEMVDLETQVAAANADLGTLGYATTPGIRGRLKKSAQISATTGIPVWYGDEVNGYKAMASNQFPTNLTKGTVTVCHPVLFGNWAEVLMGLWGELEIIVDPYAQKKRGDIEVTTFVMADVGLRHAASFAAIKDALP